ncbi:MAG: flagellar basal body rod protein FlgC [Betaproteobacteria bacterium]|nr:flagellar basal body rod protein FlgC [Betaproteobacteria bacterium]
MSLFKVFNIAGSGVQAQAARLNVVASNLANAESVAGPDGQPYRARHVVFQAQSLGQAQGLALGGEGADAQTPGVRVADVIVDSSPLRQVFDPKHPLADEQGYISLPNVNPVDEMVNMISASRSYQSNIEVMNTAKNLLQKTLQLGNS